MFNKDLNPNNVKPHEVDEVFLAQAKQVQDIRVKRAVNKYLKAPQAQRDRYLREAKDIVKKFQEKQARDAAKAAKKKKT